MGLKMTVLAAIISKINTTLPAGTYVFGTQRIGNNAVFA